MKASKAQRLLIALACALSITSTLIPFLRAELEGWSSLDVHPGPESFWSFQHTMELRSYGDSRFTVLEVLNDFWSTARYKWHGRAYMPPFVERIGPVFAGMLVTQILTILFGLLSLIKQKAILLPASAVFSAATLLLMSFVAQALDDHYAKTIGVGYILAIASTALFLTAFVWKIASRRQSNT